MNSNKPYNSVTKGCRKEG